MNKKLLPLAISAALAAGVAAPGVASADVTIYGKLHVSLDYFKADRGNIIANDDIKDFQVSSNSSRIGFKGSEDLGGGLKAIWQIETGYDLTQYSGGAWSTRNSFLGLAGGWGAVIAGKHDTPMKTVSRKLDPFGDTIMDARAIMGSSTTGSNVFNLRTGNTVAYLSPSWSGFQLVGAYVADYTDNDSSPSDNDFSAFSASATYDNGPLFAAIAWEKHKAGGNIGEPSMFRGGASYKISAFKIGFAAEKGKGDNFNTIDRWAGNVFGTYDFGKNTVKLQYVTAGEAVSDDKSWTWALGLDHKFSKRTKVYGVVGSLQQDDNARYVLGQGHNTNQFNTAGVGKNQKAVSLGMVHTF